MTMLGKIHSVESRKKMSIAKTGKHLSVSTEFKKGHKPSENRTFHVGEAHHAWKKQPGYIAIHAWVARQLGKPKKCDNCGFESENGRQFNWANLSGKYLRDTNDFIRLCMSCHKLFDLGKININGVTKTC